MSQYELTPKDSNHEVLIGWDPMLSTLFVHVWDKTKNEDDPERDILWVPKPPNFLYSLGNLIDVAWPYADIPSDIIDKLRTDMD